MAPSKKRAFPSIITASRWETVWGSCFQGAVASTGKAHALDGTLVPALTNGDAVQLVIGWHHAAPGDFPLWGQFAAQAYGWTADNGTLDVTPEQRDATYPEQISKELWLTLQSLAGVLDDERAEPVRLDLSQTFDDATVQGAVAAELKHDGAGNVTFRLSKGASVAPKKDKKKEKTSPWLTLALFYFGYRVIKNLTGGSRYTG